jgi:hypothetical protein
MAALSIQTWNCWRRLQCRSVKQGHSSRAFQNQTGRRMMLQVQHKALIRSMVNTLTIQQSRLSYIDHPPGLPRPSQSSHVQVSQSSYSKSLPFPLSTLPLSIIPLSTTRYPLLASRTAPANEKPNDTIKAILRASASSSASLFPASKRNQIQKLTTRKPQAQQPPAPPHKPCQYTSAR